MCQDDRIDCNTPTLPCGESIRCLQRLFYLISLYWCELSVHNLLNPVDRVILAQNVTFIYVRWSEISVISDPSNIWPVNRNQFDICYNATCVWLSFCSELMKKKLDQREESHAAISRHVLCIAACVLHCSAPAHASRTSWIQSQRSAQRFRD